MFHEHHSRTFIKSITWFFSALVVTFIIMMIISGGDWLKSFVEAIIIQFIKMAVYYLHERIWNKSNYGQRLKKPALVLK
jgi:uncharacterized membrane protein